MDVALFGQTLNYGYVVCSLSNATLSMKIQGGGVGHMYKLMLQYTYHQLSQITHRPVNNTERSSVPCKHRLRLSAC
jgi:hypothetical protein